MYVCLREVIDTLFLDISGCTTICKSSGSWIPAYRVSGVHIINVISGGHLCIGRQGAGRQYLRAVIGTSILDSGGGRQRERALENNSTLGVRGTQRYVFCVHLIIDHPRPGQVVFSVRTGGMDRPSRTKSHPAESLSSSQPAGRRVGPAL